MSRCWKIYPVLLQTVVVDETRGAAAAY